MRTATMDRPADIDRSNCTGTRHGTQKAYSSHKCRCPDAKAADHTRRRELRRAHVAAGRNPKAPNKDPQQVPERPLRPRITDPAVQVWSVPTRERLRILVGYGFGWDTLADLLPGVPVEALASQSRHIMARSVSNQVREVFDELIQYLSPCGVEADEALTYAIDEGWGVVDMVAIRLALAAVTLDDPGARYQVPLTGLERRAVIYYGAAVGHPEWVLSRASGLSGATVTDALERVAGVRL